MAQKMIDFEILSFVVHVHRVFLILQQTLFDIRCDPFSGDLNAAADESRFLVKELRDHRDRLLSILASLPPVGVPILRHYLESLKLF
jgi:hypothetical protein